MKKLFLRIAAVVFVAFTIMVIQQSLAQQKPAEKKVVECSNAEQVKEGKTKSCCMPSKTSAVRATTKPAEKKP